MAREAQDVRVVTTFFRSVGCELGLYNRETQALKESDHPLIETNRRIARELLKSGWILAELEQHLWDRYRAGDRVALLSEVVSVRVQGSELQEEENLLAAGESYHHPALYHKSAPVYRLEGSQRVPVSPGQLTPVDCFSLGDVVDYYFRRAHAVQPTPRVRQMVLGTFRWLLPDCRIDEILTAIDLATERNPAIGAIKVDSWLAEAKAEVKLRAAFG